MSVVGTTLIGQLYFLTLLYLQTELFKKSDLQKEMETPVSYTHLTLPTIA